MASTWSKYDARLDPKVLQKFKEEWSKLLGQADTIIDRRTETLVKWLEAPLLIDTLEDFHATSIRDGLLFEDAIGNAIFGMGSSAKGAEKIDAWVKEAKASVKTNLVWRAIALNQQEGIAEVDAALQEAEQHKSKQTVAHALAIEGYLSKMLKAFADTYKKAVSASNANVNASSEKGSKAFGVAIQPVNMRGADKIAVTVGDRVFRHFKVNALGDFVTEKIIQHMFAIRALVAPADSINLIVEQARTQGIERTKTLARLRTARTFLAADTPAIKTAQTESLGHAWENFKNTHKDGANAVRDARLAVVVMLIEGVNFQKLLADCSMKNDAKSWWSLAASSITISSALFDIASVPAKNVLGSESWSYQRLKLFGGVLSAGATAIGVGLDVLDAGKSLKKDQIAMFLLFSTKAVLGGIGAGLTVATTFTYAAPLIERLTGRVAAGVAVRAISGAAAEIIATRILFMAAGTWITVGVFGIQVFIWIISDDKLQEWCSLCVFGTKRTAPDAYKSAKQQQEKLQYALVEVGLAV
ncbi:MAG: T6SS effector BTH_I2691 family protein, partial [Rhodoferax sp.]